MKSIPQAQVLKRLGAENPWWKEALEVHDPYLAWSPRPYLDLLYPLVKDRAVRRAVVVMGPRRVGKTVLIHHVIQRLLRDTQAADSICYVSLDNPVYVDRSLDQILDLFSEATGKECRDRPCYVFFDEIQYLRDWEKHLKSLVDSYPKIQFLASGSAAAALRLKSVESGAGRFTDFLLPPLTFYEYLSLLGQLDAVQVGRRGVFTDDIHGLNELFVHYLNFGGYPEVVLNPTIQADPARFIKSDIIDKVLLRDLPSLYGIRDIQELNSLFTTLAFNTAQEVSLDQLANKSGVAKNTLKRYIEYLEAAFLVRIVHRVDKNARRFQRANFFKVYLANPSIRAALFSPLSEDDPEFGSLVETGVFSQWFHSNLHGDLRYARWKEGEVDIVGLDGSQKILWAVEVKWSDRWAARPGLAHQVVDFCSRNGLGSARITSKTKSERVTIKNVEVEFQPAALYCYQLGYNILRGKPLPPDSSL